MELDLSVAHVTCVRRLRRELDTMNAHFSVIMLWPCVDAARSYVYKHILRYQLVVSGRSSALVCTGYIHSSSP